MKAQDVDRWPTPLQRITVVFADDADRWSFDGYTTGKLWNGWECPWFDIEVAEQALARIRRKTRRATEAEAPHGGLWITEPADSPADGACLIKCQEVATVDGPRMLLDCGEGFVFQRARK